MAKDKMEFLKKMNAARAAKKGGKGTAPAKKPMLPKSGPEIPAAARKKSEGGLAEGLKAAAKVVKEKK